MDRQVDDVIKGLSRSEAWGSASREKQPGAATPGYTPALPDPMAPLRWHGEFSTVGQFPHLGNGCRVLMVPVPFENDLFGQLLSNGNVAVTVDPNVRGCHAADSIREICDSL
jgi:hypothetical protein